MNPNNNPSKNPNNNPKDRINLELSLGIGPQEQDTVEQQGKFMQLVGSVSYPPPNGQLSPPPSHHMIPPGFYNNWDVSGAALPPSPPLGAALPPSPPLGVALSSPPPLGVDLPSPPPLMAALPPSPSTYLASAQVLQPPQAIQGGSGALETPRPGTRLGRPPAGHHEIVPPYPWATTRPARIHNLRYLYSKNIFVVSGQVYCKPCGNTQTLEYNLKEKFGELHQYILYNKEQLRQRAPKVWSSPKLPPCRSCENGMKPVVGENKEEINWLFFLLGQLLGCCNLDELKYFCHKNSQHRTGAKDRVLYITYLVLCKQLEPCDLFSL